MIGIAHRADFVGHPESYICSCVQAQTASLGSAGVRSYTVNSFARARVAIFDSSSVRQFYWPVLEFHQFDCPWNAQGAGGVWTCLSWLEQDPPRCELSESCNHLVKQRTRAAHGLRYCH